MVALAADRTPLRPAKLWCDVEAVEETEQLKQQASHLDMLDRSFLAPGVYVSQDLVDETKRA
jgi:sugar (pentulose or hexulose) kinase